HSGMAVLPGEVMLRGAKRGMQGEAGARASAGNLRGIAAKCKTTKSRKVERLRVASSEQRKIVAERGVRFRGESQTANLKWTPVVMPSAR
ncbi:MAG: hypothetical protein ACOY3P_26705, partial [Planctomycetota bacterium]